MTQTERQCLFIIRVKQTMLQLDTSVLMGNTPLKKFIPKPYLGLGWHIFHILTSEDIDYFTVNGFNP